MHSRGSELAAEVSRRVRRSLQQVARRFNVTALEQHYQANYFALAGRTDWLTEMPLASIRGGTANNSLLYVLLSALRVPAVESVLEVGVGVSSGLIRQWSAGTGGRSVHLDHDAAWLQRVIPEQEHVRPVEGELVARNVAGRPIEWYDIPIPDERFNLILVDGPPAWTSATRFNRLGILEWIPDVLREDFVIVIDDASRPGEARLARLCLERLREAGREVRSTRITGIDSQCVIATERFHGLLYL